MFCLAVKVSLSHRLLKQIGNLELTSYTHPVCITLQLTLLAVTTERVVLVQTIS